MTSGIYFIKNIVNGNRYIGSAINIKGRWAAHKHELRKGIHRNSHVQRAWNLYGEESFLFEVVEFVKEKGDLLSREQFYLDKFLPEYNISKIAGSLLGMRHSEEARAKIGDAVRGRPKSIEHRQKISASHTGKKRPAFSSEWKEKIGAAIRGKKRSLETRQKMSAALKRRVRHPVSDEAKLKMSLAAKGKKKSAETIQRMIEAWKKRKSEQ